MKRHHLILLTAGIAFVTVCTVIYLNMPKMKVSGSSLPIDPNAMKVEATKADTAGMDPESALMITCKEDISSDALKAFISITPAGEFKLSRKGSGRFLLTPTTGFQPDDLVNLTVLDENGIAVKSWAFQTKAKFAVVSALPGHASNYVPVRTGIELTFSSSTVEESEFQKYFSITPAVKGTVKKAGKQVTFVPDAPLEKGTIYSIYLSGELADASGQALGKDFYMEFRTAEYDDAESKQDYDGIYNSSGSIETFLPGDTPVIEVYTMHDAIREASITTEIYRFPSFESYLEALEQEAKSHSIYFSQNDSFSLSTGGLSKVSVFESKLVGPKGGWVQYIALPEPLEEGWYLTVSTLVNPATGKQHTLKKALQISPISLYHGQLGGELVAWVNDTANGSPISGAKLDIRGTGYTYQGKTDKDGIAKLSAKTEKTISKGRTGVLTLEAGNHRFADLFIKDEDVEPTLSEQYYTYLYTDRPIYMSSDTVRVWGFVKPRSKAAQQPKALELSLDNLYRTSVELHPDGSFEGTLSFKNLGGMGGNWASVYLKEPGREETLASSGITIADYRKPIYVMDAQTDKIVYTDPLETPVKLSFSMEFFDHTPAAGIPVTVNFTASESRGTDTQATTGADGKTVISLQRTQDIEQWHPYHCYTSITSNQAEDEYYYKYLEVPMLFRDVMLTSETTTKEQSTTVEFRMNRITTENIKKAEDVYDYELLRGEAYSTPVQAELHKIYYTKTETGSYYDYIAKRSFPTYEYERHDDVVDTRTVAFKDGKAVLNDLPLSVPEEYYMLKLSYQDSKNRITRQDLWLGMDVSPYEGSGRFYRMQRKDYQEDDWSSRYRFAEGENVELELMQGETPVKTGKLLVNTVQTGIRSTAITTTTPVIPYEEQNIPNVTLSAAYFDGKHIFTVDPMQLRFDPASRELDIQITPDKETYGNRDKVAVTVLVTDKKTGKPVKNAAVSLSVVDEAVFAIQEQTVKTLESLYTPVYYRGLRTYASYVHHDMKNPNGGAEKGGGGGGGERSRFQDTAAFLTGKTGGNGKASFSFTLPDNYTSWRLTAQAITSDLNAGNSVSDIITTGTFFVQPIIPKTSLVGDDLVVALRSYGTSITTDNEVQYSGTVTGPGGYSDKVNLVSKAGEFVNMQFKPLSEGEYSITLEAKSGKHSDKVKYPLQVVKSGVEVSVSRNFDLAKGITLEAKRFPVMLGFYNQEYAATAQVLEHLASVSGSRTDQRIARRYATDLMARLSGAEFIPGVTDDLVDVLSSYGSVQLFGYSEADPELSARVAAAVPEYLYGTGPYGYFNQLITSSNSYEATCGYLGLAAHKRPVLGDIRQLLQSPAGLTTLDQYRLVAALAVIGDHDGAASYYNKLVKPKLKDEKTPAGETTTFVQASGDEVEDHAMTAYAGTIASILGRPEAETIMRYLMTKPGTDPYLLEQIIYVKSAKPFDKEKAAAFSYQSDEGRRTVALNRLGLNVLTLSEEQFQKAGFKTEQGKVGVRAFYMGSPEEAMSMDYKSIKVTKGINQTKLRIGDSATITIKIDIPKGEDIQSVVIDDYIPTGMRFVGLSGGKGAGGWYVRKQEGQRIQLASMMRYFNETGDNRSIFSDSISILVRPVIPGTYVLESAFATVGDRGLWGMSEKSEVQIESRPAS